MKGKASSLSSKEMAQIRQNLESVPDIEEAAELMSLAGNSTRLKLLYLLDNAKELGVCDLAEKLSISVSATSQHLSKLKAYGLVAPRRDAQTIYYRLTEHTFNAKLQVSFLRQFEIGAGEPERGSDETQGGPVEYCFPAWTRVALADGTHRLISELLPGDSVQSWDRGRAAVALGRVARVVAGTAARLILINGRLAASPEHRILTARGYVPFGEVEIGDQMVSIAGGDSRVVCEIESLAGATAVYNLDVVPFASFFAEGLAVEDYTGEERAAEGAGTSEIRLDRVVADAACGQALA